MKMAASVAGQASNQAAAAAGSPFVKPAVPPRPRSILSDNSKKHHNNNLNNVMNAKNSRAGGSNNVGDQYAMDLMPSKEADLSNEKCKDSIAGLK